MNLWRLFINGIFEQNPIFRLALSLCPALAVTNTAVNGLGMGLSVMFVITANNTVVSLVRHFIHPKVRIPVYITIIATLVTVTQLVLEAYFPALFKALGIYLALIVVFAIILARAEVFAAKNPVLPSFIDGLGMGAGFAGAMVLIGIIREVLGAGTVFGVPVLGAWYNPILIMVLPPGGFLVIGLMMGTFNTIGQYLDKRRARAQLAAPVSAAQAGVAGGGGR